MRNEQHATGSTMTLYKMSRLRPRFRDSRIQEVSCLLTVLLACLFAGPTGRAFAQSPVYVIPVDGAITPSKADFIHSAIEKATEHNAECLIVKLNTPGGLLKSTRVIVTDLLSSPVPIIVFVAPSGSQAASAGVFVTLAAHIAAMAPGTNIGAAHPVSIGEQTDSVMSEKATNDAAAFIRTISEKRHRNIQWAEEAVRKSVSITETEALEMRVVDLIAKDVPDLLEAVDGRSVDTPSGTRVLHTAGAQIVAMEPGFREQILDILSDPNIAYILMMIGIYGLLFELYNPGSIFPGVIGGISLLLAFYSLHTLPINYAGLGLIIFAVILFILEIKIVSHGLLTIGGVISLFLGSVMLIQTESPFDVLTISWSVILAVVICTTGFFLFAIGMGIKAQVRKPTTGTEGIVGEEGVALSDLSPDGMVQVHGEIWAGTSIEGTIPKGATVTVVSLINLRVNVRSSTHVSGKE